MLKYLVVIAVGLSACGGSSSSARWTETDIEYRLTAVAGETPTDARVDIYATALAAAERTCPNTRAELSDIAVRGVSVAQGVGKTTTVLDLLRAIPRASSAAPGVDCSQIVAGIIALMN